LILVIADYPDAERPGQPWQVALELAAKLRVRDVVDDTGEAVAVGDGETAAHRAEVRVVVGTVVEIGNTVAVGHHPEESAHDPSSDASSVG
jgi:hypothetical protein